MLITITVSSQSNILSLEEAIDKAILQNEAIKIQRLETQMAANNVFKANAGKTPFINVIGSATYDNNFSGVKLRTFQAEPEFIEIDESGVESLTLNLGVRADYTLLDGGQGNIRYQLLTQESTLTLAQQELIISQTALGVSELYLEILRLQNQAGFLKENITNGEARIQKTQDRKAYGKASGLDILRLQTAVNEDQAALDQVEMVQLNLMKDLNFLMGEPLDNSFELVQVEPTIEIANLESIRADVLSNNPQLLLSKQSQLLSESQLSLAQTQRKPTLGTFAQLGYFYQRNDVQQLARIQNAGISLGLSVSYNLFDGGIINNQIQNARIDLDLSKMRTEQLVNQIMTQAAQSLNTLSLLESQLEREQRNLQTFEEAYERTQSLFLSGKASNLDIRDAELARLNVLLRIDQLKIDRAKASIQLNQLRGKLVE